MKTTYTPEVVGEFLTAKKQAIPGTLEQLTEGHMSQAFSYEIDLGKFVLRIGLSQNDFLMTKI